MQFLFAKPSLWTFVVLTLFATCHSAHGENLQSISKAKEENDTGASVAKYRDYLPRQILALSNDERKSSVPIVFNWAANLMASPAGDLNLKYSLNTLMYNGLADYEGAKRRFQFDLAEKPTGELTVWQIRQLNYRASRMNMTHTQFFPSNFHGMMVAGTLASVKGTVKLLGDRIAYPINHVVIKCSRREGTCDYRQIALLLPDENSWSQSYYVGNVKDETYSITRWDGNQIDAIPLDNTACRTNQLSLNFETKEFFEITRNNTAGDCETPMGVTLPRLDKPRISQIVDGTDIINAEFKAISDEAYTFLSSRFRASIEALGSE
ncbi:hypothetical protein [Pseudovibrio sp. WM33]|uniref:hypothetical protein n=1 Tax=Pseudovibrio sp. WM33 TaxID=1735585 RepID=UPI0007AE4F52|nr:hypothetical protein [Pseudovibrio sp. WM33]KZL23384.1 hypothetical protein PsWM33_03573 [Pseudovibrio sp. WM33]